MEHIILLVNVKRIALEEMRHLPTMLMRLTMPVCDAVLVAILAMGLMLKIAHLAFRHQELLTFS